jgi:hypothetical protein
VEREKEILSNFLFVPNFYRKEVRKMDEKRMQEIALALAKAWIREREIRLDRNSFRRELGNMAKVSGISMDELVVFFKTLIQEAVDEMLA